MVTKHHYCGMPFNLHFTRYISKNIIIRDTIFATPIISSRLLLSDSCQSAVAATEVVSYIKTEPWPRLPVVCNEALKHLGCSRRVIRDGWCEFGAGIEAIRKVGRWCAARGFFSAWLALPFHTWAPWADRLLKWRYFNRQFRRVAGTIRWSRGENEDETVGSRWRLNLGVIHLLLLL